MKKEYWYLIITGCIIFFLKKRQKNNNDSDFDGKYPRGLLTMTEEERKKFEKLTNSGYTIEEILEILEKRNKNATEPTFYTETFDDDDIPNKEIVMPASVVQYAPLNSGIQDRVELGFLPYSIIEQVYNLSDIDTVEYGTR